MIDIDKVAIIYIPRKPNPCSFPELRGSPILKSSYIGNWSTVSVNDVDEIGVGLSDSFLGGHDIEPGTSGIQS